jgi:multisubunit Na+/H+ antiporter MnhB subunit
MQLTVSISIIFIDLSYYHNSRRKIRKELVFTITTQAIIAVALTVSRFSLFTLLFEKKRGKRG